MDRALQERVVGAIVLVIVAVLIVPVFLDGSAEDSATETTVVSLPGQNKEQQVTQKIVLNRNRTEPVPVSSQPAPKKPPQNSPAVAAVVEKPAAEGSSPEQASSVAESSTGMWAVQLGSFSSKENAEGLAARLRKRGYAAFLSQHDTGAGQLQRVRVGPQKDRASAESVALQLEKFEDDVQVVPHP
jgi:DedD protein